MSWWYYYAICFLVLLIASEISSPKHSWVAKLFVAALGPISLLIIVICAAIQVVKFIWKGNE